MKMSSWAYMPGLLLITIPISLYTFLVGIFCFIPGIVFGYKYSNILERSGTDFGVNAGRAISNVMWLGIGILVLLAFVILMQIIIGVGSSQYPW